MPIVERIELKSVFTKRFAHLRVREVQSSRLWSHMARGDSKAKVLETLLVPATSLKYSQRMGEEELLFTDIYQPYTVDMLIPVLQRG